MTAERFVLPLVQRRSVQQVPQPRIKTDHFLLLFPGHIPVNGIAQHAIAVVYDFRLRGMQQRGQDDQEECNERRVSCGLRLKEAVHW